MQTLMTLRRRCLYARPQGIACRLFHRIPVVALALSILPAWCGAQLPSAANGQTPASPPTATTAKSAAARPDPHRADQAYQQGRRAEQAADWEAAYTAYSEATGYAPANQTYAAMREHARFQFVQSLADLSERRFLAGDIPGARQQLLHVLQIDPTYSIARERLGELPENDGRATTVSNPRLAGPPHVQAQAGTRNFDVRGTTHSAYQDLGRQFGVTVVFDGDLADRSIRFQVPQVDYETAVTVLERQTHTFTRVVDEHTLFVADDTAQKRRDYELEVEKALYLPDSETPDEMNETVRTIREMTGISRTQLDAAAHTLTVRSTPHNVALAQALLEQIEQPRGEVMLEIEILEVDRQAAHQLGITPPTSAQTFTLSAADVLQLQQAQNNGTLVQVLQTIFGVGGALASTGVNPLAPALIAFGGGKTIYFATLPNASVNFAQTLNSVRSAQRVLLRAEDGKPATFFVGDRYPVSLGILSSDLGALPSAFASGGIAGDFPRQDFATGDGPVAVAIADLNGDGHSDLVVANQAANTISILLGNGDGTFQTHTDITVGTAPTAVAIADFNGDGKPDIAVANSGDNTVSILMGNGDGTFAAPVTYMTGLMPVALVAQDFNADGHPDLAVVNQTDGTVSILLDQANGTFAPKKDYAVGTHPTAIAVWDLSTTNSIPDLVVTNSSANTVSVLLGNGDGTFNTKTDYSTGADPVGVALADFNRDGKLDLSVTNQTDNTVSVLLGNGDGTFQTQTATATGTGPTGVAAVDVTGSGIPDLIITDQTADTLTVLLGNGDGTFTTPLTLPTGNAPVGVAVADVNGDGLPDVVTANNSSDSVSVILNSLSAAAAATSAASSFAQMAYPSSEYIDLGLKVKATPRVHEDNEVSLDLEFDISSLSGTAINGIPILSNRTINQVARLRQDQTSVISGVLQSSEITTLNGWPGFSTVPGIGLATGEQTSTKQDTEMLIVITPRSLRLPPRNPPTLYAGPGEPTNTPAGAPELPNGAPGPPGRGLPPVQATPPQGVGPGTPATPAPGTPALVQPPPA